MCRMHAHIHSKQVVAPISDCRTHRCCCNDSSSSVSFFCEVNPRKGSLEILYLIYRLDYQTGLPREKILPVHGSIGKVECEFCKHPIDPQVFADLVKTKIKNIYPDSATYAGAFSITVSSSFFDFAGILFMPF